MIIDLTAVHACIEPAPLLDMFEGQSRKAFKTWLTDREDAWRAGDEVLSIDESTGSKPPKQKT